MYHKHQHENRYCNKCRQTTNHHVVQDGTTAFKCQRCGCEQQRSHSSRKTVALVQETLIATTIMQYPW